MLPSSIAIEPDQTLPANDGEGRIERVKFRDLDVRGIFVLDLVVRTEGNSGVDVIALLGRAADDPHNALKSGRRADDAKPNCDEGDAVCDQPIHDRALGLAAIHANKCEIDPFEQAQIFGRQGLIVLHKPLATKLGVDVVEIVYLRLLRLELGERPRAWSTEGVMGVEAVAVKQSNLRDARFGDEVKNIRPRSANADDGDALTFQLLVIDADTCAKSP